MKVAVPMKLSIIVPFFNEAKNIILVIKRLRELMADAAYAIEVIIVDGCSTDDTPQVLREEFENLDPNQFKYILMEKRGGYGHDIMCGVSIATGEVLSSTHADMQTDPVDVLKVYEIYVANADSKCIIKGKRKNRRLSETFYTFGMQIATWCILKKYLDDINAQPKLFSRKFYEKYMRIGAPDDFSLDLFCLYTAKYNGCKILEIPVVFADRIHGEAKGGGGSWKNRYRLIRRTFKYILKLRANFL